MVSCFPYYILHAQNYVSLTLNAWCDTPLYFHVQIYTSSFTSRCSFVQQGGGPNNIHTILHHNPFILALFCHSSASSSNTSGLCCALPPLSLFSLSFFLLPPLILSPLASPSSSPLITPSHSFTHLCCSINLFSLMFSFPLFICVPSARSPTFTFFALRSPILY